MEYQERTWRLVLSAAALAAVLLVSGCTQGPGGGVNVSPETLKNLPPEVLRNVSKEAVICNPPYIRVGLECCLDQNNNGVCDRDEGIGTPPASSASSGPLVSPSAPQSGWSRIYTDADVTSAINEGKATREEKEKTAFSLRYGAPTPEGFYSVATPYAVAVGAVRRKVINYEDISESDVRTTLKSNLLGISTQVKTKEAYYSFKQPKVTALVKDGDKIYKAASLTINSEVGDFTSDTPYKTTVTGVILGFEDFGKKQVDLIFVIDDKEWKYSVDFNKFK